MNRILRNPVWRVLARIGDLAIVGLLVIIASAPLVTVPAALAAGTAAFADRDAAAGFRPFWRAWSRTLRRGLPWGLAGVLLVVAGVVDLFGAAAVRQPLEQAAVTAAGTLTLMLLAAVGPYLALVLLGEPSSIRQAARSVATLMLLAPGGAVQAIGLLGLAGAALLLFPVAAVPLLGAYAAVAVGIESRIARRLDRHRRELASPPPRSSELDPDHAP